MKYRSLPQGQGVGELKIGVVGQLRKGGVYGKVDLIRWTWLSYCLTVFLADLLLLIIPEQQIDLVFIKVSYAYAG